METIKFTFSFVSTFASTLWLFWMIFVYPHSNISLKSAWYGTAAGAIAAIVFVLLLGSYISGVWPKD